eukprot:gi/632989687/ref/XP_007883780.1/ PREDICTED: cytochrome P450 2K1-like [Callorhinchus milii]
MALLALALPAVDLTTALLLCSLVMVLLLFLASGRKTDPRFPAGPAGLPIIGNLHQVKLSRLHESLMQLSEKHGCIFSLRLGQQDTVVLTGYEVVKDALVNHAEEFMGRPHDHVNSIHRKNHGVILADGESWKQMRRFTLSTLRDFGMGKKSVEDKIIEEASHLSDVFQSYKGQPFETTILTNGAVANVICSILLGNRFNYDDQTFVNLIRIINENIRLAISPTVQLINFVFPFLDFLPGKHKTFLSNATIVRTFLRKILKENRQDLNIDSVRSFIQAFMVKQQEESGNPKTYFHEENLVITTNDLFVAGMETTSTTLRWAILLMMKFPDFQQKVHEEIDQVIGTDRHPRLEDRKAMPFTDAVIHETQRFGNIVPLNLPHATTADTNFRGYFIPKGTRVIPLLTSVLYDKTQWEKPNEFNPSHFLDVEGKFRKRDAFMPFSAGRRACAGESLAKAELFLFFSTLMQRFRFQPPPGVTDLPLTAIVGITSSPTPYKLCAVLR